MNLNKGGLTTSLGPGEGRTQSQGGRSGDLRCERVGGCERALSGWFLDAH